MGKHDKTKEKAEVHNNVNKANKKKRNILD